MAAQHGRRLRHLPRARDTRRAAVLDAAAAGGPHPYPPPPPALTLGLRLPLPAASASLPLPPASASLTTAHTHAHPHPHPHAAARSTYGASYYSHYLLRYLLRLTAGPLRVPRLCHGPNPNPNPDPSPSPSPNPSPNPHQALSAYDASAVRACIVELHSLHRKATSATLRAVFDKYATPDLLAVSGLTPPETLPLVLDTSA